MVLMRPLQVNPLDGRTSILYWLKRREQASSTGINASHRCNLGERTHYTTHLTICGLEYREPQTKPPVNHLAMAVRAVIRLERKYGTSIHP